MSWEKSCHEPATRYGQRRPTVAFPANCLGTYSGSGAYQINRDIYLGHDSAGSDEIEAQLDKYGAKYQRLDGLELYVRAAEILKQQNVIGCFQGRMEFGPRALGGRSIIRDPRSSKIQSVMNLKIKYWESFRPAAPSVLADRVSDYFELDSESPYVLIVAAVRERLQNPMTEKQSTLVGIERSNVPKSELPAITNVDYSARIQTAHAETNSRYPSLLRAVKDRTGCGVLVNTPFNVRGEPINSPATLRTVYRGSMRCGLMLKKITTPIILTLVYAIAIVPTSIALRLLSKDLLHLQFENSESCRVSSKDPSIWNMEKPHLGSSYLKICGYSLKS
jgi:predicted NodU family carbamoyl transferase